MIPWIIDHDLGLIKYGQIGQLNQKEFLKPFLLQYGFIPNALVQSGQTWSHKTCTRNWIFNWKCPIDPKSRILLGSHFSKHQAVVDSRKRRFENGWCRSSRFGHGIFISLFVYRKHELEFLIGKLWVSPVSLTDDELVHSKCLPNSKNSQHSIIEFIAWH